MPELLPSKALLPVLDQEEAVVEAEQRAPGRVCRAASAAWAAGSARQSAARGVALREAAPQAVEHKPPTTFTEAQAWAVVQLLKLPKGPVAAEVPQQPVREAPQARVLQRPERLVWPAQRQLGALLKPSKVRERRIRNNHIQESILKKTN